MLLKHDTISIRCSDKLQKARKAISLETKLAVLTIEQQWAAEGEREDNTPQHSCVSPMADAFCNFENCTQKILDTDPNCERSFKFEHAIQNAVSAHKQLCQGKVSQT